MCTFILFASCCRDARFLSACFTASYETVTSSFQLISIHLFYIHRIPLPYSFYTEVNRHHEIQDAFWSWSGLLRAAKHFTIQPHIVLHWSKSVYVFYTGLVHTHHSCWLEAFRWKSEITIVLERCALSFFSPLVVGMQGSCVHALLPSMKQSRPASNVSRFIFLYIEYHYHIHSTLKLIGIINKFRSHSIVDQVHWGQPSTSQFSLT